MSIHTRPLIVAQIPRLRRYARFMVQDGDLADDLVQDCLERAVDKIDMWQPGTNMGAWLTTILRNVIISHWRRVKRRPISVELDETSFAVTGGQEANIEMLELRRALQRLTREHKQILFLVAVEGRAYEDAAALLGIPVGTVRSRLFRARTALRLLLDSDSRSSVRARSDNDHPIWSRGSAYAGDLLPTVREFRTSEAARN